MGAEGEPEPNGPKRWKAFLTYAHDDNPHYVRNFHKVFTRELKRLRIGISDEFYLDTQQLDTAGDVKRYLEKHASRSDFLIIFVGKHYPSRPFCLQEWLAFRKQFDDDEVRERLLIIETDKGAIETLLKVSIEDQEAVAEQRGRDLNDCFHEKFWSDDGRIISTTPGGTLNEMFEQKVERVAEIFANKYREKESVEQSPGAAPEWARPNEVLIGPWTEDLKADVKALCDAFRAAGRSCACLPTWTGIRNADKVLLEQMRVAISAVEYFVQPYSIAHVECEAGQQVHFDFFNDRRAPRPLYYWRPTANAGGANLHSDAEQEIRARWNSEEAWVAKRLKEVELSAIVGPPPTVLSHLRPEERPQDGPKIFLGGVVRDERELSYAELRKFKDYATDMRNFLAPFSARQPARKIKIEIAKVSDFLSFDDDTVSQYSGVVLLNKFTQITSLKAQMEAIQRKVETASRRCQFGFFVCIPPGTMWMKEDWRPIIFQMNGVDEERFAPGEYDSEDLERFFDDVVRCAS